MKRLFIYLTAVTFIFSACVSSINIAHDFDRRVDFTQFKTYYILPWDASVNTRTSISTRQRLEDAIMHEMNRRGFVYQPEGGQLAVGISILIEEMVEYTSSGSVNYNMGWGGMGWGMGGWGMGGWGHPGMMGGVGWTGPTTVTPSKFKNGTLILNIFEAQQKTLIFESVGSDRMNSDPQRDRDRIPSYMKLLFRDFPIRPLK